MESHYEVDVHLLDDGFQHLKLQRDLNLLLLDVTDPFGGGHVPPMGRLREPLIGIRRADAVLITRVQAKQSADSLCSQLRLFNPVVPVFLVRQRLVSASHSGSGDSYRLEKDEFEGSGFCRYCQSCSVLRFPAICRS